MSKSTTHPYEELLAAYSAGSLPLSQALCISAHLEHCEPCTQKLARLNRVGSEMMQQLKSACASDELKNRLLDSLDSLTVDDIEEQHQVTTDPSVPRCLQQFIDHGYEDLAAGMEKLKLNSLPALTKYAIREGYTTLEE